MPFLGSFSTTPDKYCGSISQSTLCLSNFWRRGRFGWDWFAVLAMLISCHPFEENILVTRRLRSWWFPHQKGLWTKETAGYSTARGKHNLCAEYTLTGICHHPYPNMVMATIYNPLSNGTAPVSEMYLKRLVSSSIWRDGAGEADKSKRLYQRFLL